MTHPAPAQAKLLQLRERFAAALPQRIDELANAVARWKNQPGALHDVERRFHSLAGTAGTYGMRTISELAARGEDACAINAPRLLEELRTLIDAMRRSLGVAPPRILCVDDDPMHNWFLASVLASEGYEIHTAGDGAHFSSMLARVRPDLIVMDYVLPDATGVELARTVRRDRSFATVPIVFLTRKRSVEHRIEATIVGGDDYLTKPVDPQLLLSVVASRVQRSKSVRALIDHDGLTSVLNRAAFMRRAETVIAESKRHPEPAALVMLDLDYFKSINDVHGHLTGDQVLMTFASYLLASVRPGDDVGRYGGEEFVLLLRGIRPDDAQKLVSRLLEEFAHVQFPGADGQPFHVTFSAGLAMHDAGLSLHEWTRRADEALYAAKHNGRARIEAA